MINHLAVVSQTRRVSLSKLSVAAAALQKQVQRDFRRYWNIDATVSAFGDLRDVPLGYWHLIIRDDIPFDAAGIHLNEDNGQPYALIRYSSNWALTLSHEALEMLADPFGRRIQAGDSIKAGQGRVEYLVEVCDPCEAAQYGYRVNGVLLSDFYTPAFFDPVGAPGVAYSYTGHITRPRQLLEGGYITWRDPVSTHVFQSFLIHGQQTFKDLGALPGGFSLREFADRNSIEVRVDVMEKADSNQPAAMLTAAAADVTESESLIDKAQVAGAESVQAKIDKLLSIRA